MKKTLKLFEILIIFNSNMFQEIKKKNFKHVIQKAWRLSCTCTQEQKHIFHLAWFYIYITCFLALCIWIPCWTSGGRKMGGSVRNSSGCFYWQKNLQLCLFCMQIIIFINILVNTMYRIVKYSMTLWLNFGNFWCDIM